MKTQLKYLVFLSLISFSFAAESVGWLDQWLNVNTALLLWTILTFFVLLFILRWKAWGPLMEALDNREKQISEALSAAQVAKDEAAKVASDNEEVLNKARQEAHEIVTQAREAGEKLKKKQSKPRKKAKTKRKKIKK